MFRRRSSKELSAKIGYDHVNGKASKNTSVSSMSSSTPAASNAVAPVASIPPPGGHLHHKQGSCSPGSSSSRKTTGMPSPEADSGVDPSATERPSPLAALKPLPPAEQQQQQQQQQQEQVISTKAASKADKRAAAAPKVVAEPPSNSLVIGEGVLFEGATEGCAAAVVGGKLVGTVKSKRLEVTRAGKMEGTAVVEMAEIAGAFEGNLTVTKALKICSTGRFKGEVSFGSIVVENGGKLEGKVNYGGCREPVMKTAKEPPQAPHPAKTRSTSTSSSSSSSSSSTKKRSTVSAATPAAPFGKGPGGPVTTKAAVAAAYASGLRGASAPMPFVDVRQSPE
ncbi:unnamed protein product [Ectocarpus sp. CCAP 1310/34]|nr:unnamed protein product [Ectocarpus sp. CCAP 1310/34]